VDGELALHLAEALAGVVGKTDQVGGGIETALRGRERGGLRFDRHLTVPDTNHNFTVSRRGIGLALLAAVALATGFVLADQVRTQLLTPSNQVARYQALVRNVQELEATNADSRSQIADLRAQIEALESQAAGRSATTQSLRSQVSDLQAHAGLVALHGPGVEVVLRNGVPGPATGGQAGYLVNFQDVQDVVNLLFAQGAEAVAVNGRRITPLTSFAGTEGQIVIDEGPPISSPVKIDAIGDRNRMLSSLDDQSQLLEIRARQLQFGLHLTYEGIADVSLPAYDSSLQVTHASPA
jgi:uncharacterized protein YlxW (UPF0749 family)